MEGTSLSTNQPSRTVTSYISNEIFWGNTFKSCVKYDREKKSYKVSHKRFNTTTEVETPLCSAKRLAEIYSEIVLSNCDSDTNLTVESPDQSSQRTSVSPESGIVVSPVLKRPGEDYRNEEYESSDFSSAESSDEEQEKSRIRRFQIRKRSSIIVSTLLESLQKYVSYDGAKNESTAEIGRPLETSL